jgi:hypothetical protein
MRLHQGISISVESSWTALRRAVTMRISSQFPAPAPSYQQLQRCGSVRTTPLAYHAEKGRKVRKTAILMAAIASIVGLSGGPASGADRTGNAAAQTEIALGTTGCTIPSGGSYCQSSSIPANPTTHSVDYEVPARACYRRMQIVDASNGAIVKDRGVAPGYPGFGSVPGLWGSYRVRLIEGCGGDSASISN